MKLVKDFEEFIELLNKNEVKYLVVGGYAFAIHAYPRFTNDIDFFILTTKPNVDKIISVLKEFGFEVSSISADDLLKKDKVIQLGEPPYRIDILTSIDGVNFEDAWNNRIKGNYGNQALYFISKEDLIKNKKASARKKDLDDLNELES
ncbi:MAG: nucleotidyltransferase [Ignavibacteriaceae bacterium]|nr:nucleotidyltransferase [Ignavibacteriaceae bacterium]